MMTEDIKNHIQQGDPFCILADMRNYLAYFPAEKKMIEYIAGEAKDTKEFASIYELAISVESNTGHYDQFRTMKPKEA